MKKYAHVSYDYKEGGCEEEYERALKEFGLVMTEDPLMEGSDQFGFFITEGKPTKKELKEIVKDCYGNLLD